MEEKLKNIPNHWIETTLEQISKVITDGTHKTPKYVDNGIPFISIANIKPFKPINFDKYVKYITLEEHIELCKRAKPEKDDILFPRIGTLGYAKRLDIDYELSIFVGLGLIKPFKEFIIPKFIEYYMNTPFVYKYSFENATGTGRLTLPLEASRLLPFPLSPLNEQKRIVEKIDELFSDLDNGVANLRKAQNQLKIYRQALLKNAFEGKLTEQWRKKNNPEPAEKLLERIKEERQKCYEQELKNWKEAVKKWEDEGKKGKKPKKPKALKEIPPLTKEELGKLPKLPEEWKWVYWNDILDYDQRAFKRGPFGSSLTKSIFVKSGYQVYEQYNAINNDPYRARYFITKKKYEELKDFSVKTGDFIISCSGSIGKITVIPKNFKEGVINQALLRVRINKRFVGEKFFLYFFRAKYFQEQILQNSTGSAIQNIKGVNELKIIPVLLCSLEEQNEIVRILDKHFSVIGKLEEEIEKALIKSETLRQSILKKAFEGKLVSQDPNDEPASILLERIKKEKEKYLEEQKEKERKPVKRKQMDKNLSIEEVLKKSKEPLPAKDVWQQSKHKDDIEAFYAELKKIQHKIKEIKKGTESLLELKNEN